jgi:hypothetical protein
MQNAILEWLVTDFDVFGLRIQHWMPVVALAFVVFFVFSSLIERIFRK